MGVVAWWCLYHVLSLYSSLLKFGKWYHKNLKDIFHVLNVISLNIRVFSILLFLNEFSPLLRQKYIYNYFPYLSLNYSKSILLLIFSTFQLKTPSLTFYLQLVTSLSMILYEFLRRWFAIEKRAGFVYPVHHFSWQGQTVDLSSNSIEL